MAKYKYKNTKTKVILETDCKIEGGFWAEVKPRGKAKPTEEVQEQVQDEQLPNERGALLNAAKGYL